MAFKLKKIRITLLQKGELTKYLTYALGETIIVTIGILLALFLSNWNQTVSNNKLEKQYYQSIKDQLKEDTDVLSGEIAYNQRHYFQFRYASHLIETNAKTSIDTLGKIAFNMVRFSDFRRKSNTYQTLINSGEVVLLKNDQITESLQNLEEIYLYINRLEENHSTIILSQIIPELKEPLQFNPNKVILPDIIFSYRFKNNFDMLTELMREKEEAYTQAMDMIQTIIGLIERELEG